MSSEKCHDCGASVGELHDDGCDVERCPDCGGQLISCGCVELEHPRIAWDGEWPNSAACREFGFWCYWGPGWIRCEQDHPQATGDMNRLHSECRWDADLQKWVLIKAKDAT